MCNFLSALILRNGDVLWHPMLDSHTQLHRYYDIPDDAGAIEHVAKAELVPSDETILDPEKWAWKIDEPTRPSWLDDVEDNARKKLVYEAKKMILVEGHKEIIADGCWIVGGTATVAEIVAGRVYCIRDSARVDYIHDSAKVDTIRGSAKVDYIGGSAKVERDLRVSQK